jgi:hypothetical protein
MEKAFTALKNHAQVSLLRRDKIARLLQLKETSKLSFNFKKYHERSLMHRAIVHRKVKLVLNTFTALQNHTTYLRLKQSAAILYA